MEHAMMELDAAFSPLMNELEETMEQAYEALHVLTTATPRKKAIKAGRNLLKAIEKLDSFKRYVNQERQKMLDGNPSHKQPWELVSEFLPLAQKYFRKAMRQSVTVIFFCGRFDELKKFLGKDKLTN